MKHPLAFVKYALLALLVLIGSECLLAQSFDRFFADRTLRVDYFHTGTKGTETFSLDKLYLEGAWPGSMVNLIDTLNLGEYMVRVYDRESSSLIYCRGYSTLFAEWQSTDEALAGILRTFSETVRLPFPKGAVRLTISRRDRSIAFREVFSAAIDPNSPVDVNREKRNSAYRVLPLMENGSPHSKVDIVILGDGYAKADLGKFRKDVKHFNDLMFSTSPFKDRKADFNVRAVEVISEESGIDKPDKGVWKRTALGTTYNTFGSPRYVLTDENRALRDIAGAVPYDFVIILLNDNRYGGGGIYNLYSTCFTKPVQADMAWEMDYVYVHEFGHCFGGLADEYYTSQVSYNDLYPKGVEPWEPNITPLLDPANLKWKNLLSPGTPVPTPWEKAVYDSLEHEKGKLDRLAADYYTRKAPIMRAEGELLAHSKYKERVGAFQGAGYASEGFYRPSLDCRMFTLSLKDFDPVCRAAIVRVIDFYAH